MKQPRIAALGLPVLVGLLAVSTSGCLFSPKEDNPGGGTGTTEYAPQTSPANVLDNLRTAYENRDLDAYKRLFDDVEFTFKFDPVDVEENPNELPVSWEWADELSAHENMFHSDEVLRIDLEFIEGEVQDVDESDGTDVDPAWKKMTITAVHLEVETKNPDDPTDNIIYLVQGDRALYFFKEYPEELVEDENGNPAPLWRITEWRDIRVGPRPLGPVS